MKIKLHRPVRVCVAYSRKDSKMFSVTSNCFSLFNNMPPTSKTLYNFVRLRHFFCNICEHEQQSMLSIRVLVQNSTFFYHKDIFQNIN